MMKFDAIRLFSNLQTIGDHAHAAEALGFDGLWLTETNTDPFLSMTLAAEHSINLNIGSAIALAFPRSPTILAMLGWDLTRYSNGRFILGLGSQVRAHNERRLGVKWEKPVRKLRETIEAMHALWNCWQHGTPLNYKGEFFRLNLMTPFFTPQPLPKGVNRPPVFISAVNSGMLRLVGRLCDGVHIHSFHTKKYLEEFARPEIEVGLTDSGRSWEDVTVNSSIFVVPTNDPADAQKFEQFVRQQISFYMSTPAYRVVNELHGWTETSAKLGKMARRGDWDEMPNLITDEMLDEMALSGTWAELPKKLQARYTGLLDRTGYYLEFTPGERDADWQQTLAGFDKG